jgi:hypothetical protein
MTVNGYKSGRDTGAMIVFTCPGFARCDGVRNQLAPKLSRRTVKRQQSAATNPSVDPESFESKHRMSG